MSYTFKAKCVSSSQNPAGTHTATLVCNGEQVVIPSILQAQKPIAPVAPKPIQQPLQQQKPVVKP